MSATSLTKELLSIDYMKNEDQFVECLNSVLTSFLLTRNPIFPRQDVVIFLLKVITNSASLQLIKLSIATLTEFCDKSNTYDANFVKRQLISLKIVRIACVILSGNRLYKDKKLSELCLSLVRRLSDVLLPAELQITLSDIVPLCMSLCDMRKQVLFTYGSAIKQKMEELMLNRSLVIQEHNYDSGASREKCDLMSKIFGCKQMQLFHCIGDVYDTNSDVDKNLSVQLTEVGLAWCNHETEPVVTESQTNKMIAVKWRDIIPSQIVDGPHFFAHELDKLNQISDIEELLQDLDHISLTSLPASGELVTVRGLVNSPHSKLQDTKIFYRAQVCRAINKNEYQVISLDYGLVQSVTFNQLYMPCQTLIHIMPSTTLFTLKGVTPSPFSVELLDTALSILQTLTDGNFTISELLINQWSVVRVLNELAATSPDQGVCKKSLLVLAHIAHCSRVRTNGMVSDNAITLTLRLLGRFVRLKWRDVLLSACIALSAMVLDNPIGAEQLEKGLPDLIHLLSDYETDTEVRAAVLQIIRNYLGNIDVAKGNSAIDSLEAISSQLPSNPSMASTMRSSLDRLSSNDRLPSPTDISPVGRASRVLSRQMSRGSEARSRTGSRHRQINLNELADQIVDETNSQRGAKPKTKSVSMPEELHRDYYALGEITNLTSSESCSIHDSDKSMDCNTVQKLIAGFLNAGIEGRLVYGIENGGKVMGIHINRDRRDQLRLGLDRVCADFIPPLTYNIPTLYFLPVCFAEGSGDAALRSYIPSRFVVAGPTPFTLVTDQVIETMDSAIEVTEIVISSSIGIDRGYTLRADNRIFVRVGTENVETTTQHFREIITKKLEDSQLNDLQYGRDVTVI